MSSYEKYIVANTALFTCMESVPEETYLAMSAAQQQSVCKPEADVVAKFLRDDTLTFRNLISDRIASLKAPQQ